MNLNSVGCEKVSSDIMWDRLKIYFVQPKVLEVGAGETPCADIIIRNSKEIERIDIDKNILKLSEVDPDFVRHKVMDAKKLEYLDNVFDVVLCINSYHEMDPEIQTTFLEEAYRVLKSKGHLIIIDPTEFSVANKLFKIFDPNEDHAQRIRNSFQKLGTFIRDRDMRIVLNGKTEFIDSFESEEEYLETMLSWWDDVKIPANEVEKIKMVKQISYILDRAGMLDGLKFLEDSQFLVISKST